MSWALITGASSGMGLKYADRLAGTGYDVVLVSNQKEDLEIAADVFGREYKIRAVPLYQDLSLPEAADNLYAYCKENGIELEILINNAGMFFFKELESADIQRVDAMMNLHMMTVTRLSILFGNDMKTRGHGRIMIISSLAASLPMPGITIYSSTKSYLKTFGRSLYYEMRPYGVSVTTVCPAAIATPLYHLSPRLMDIGIRTGVIWKADRLVKRAMKAMFRGRRIIRPGFMNIYLPVLVRMLPDRLVCHIWKKVK